MKHPLIVKEVSFSKLILIDLLTFWNTVQTQSKVSAIQIAIQKKQRSVTQRVVGVTSGLWHSLLAPFHVLMFLLLLDSLFYPAQACDHSDIYYNALHVINVDML